MPYLFARFPGIFKRKALLYASKTFLGATICWYGLQFCGIANPVWAVITVILISDPDLTTTFGLAKARTINTLVGCFFGLGSLLLFGYNPALTLLTVALTVLCVTLIEKYPANWRLAPATVIILMDASRGATSHQEEINYVLMRVGEIGAGSAVALILSALYTKYAFKIFPPAPPAAQATGSVSSDV